jgi:two-component system NtrC family response regulator/two-component system response regulator HydG
MFPAMLADRHAPRILIVGGDPELGASVAGWLRADGCQTDSVSDIEPALAALQVAPPDIVIADARLPSGSGIALLEAARRLCPPLSVILMSAEPTVTEAVRAMQLGAESYLAKNAAGELRRTVRTIADRLRSRRGEALRGRPQASRGLVGDSPAMRRVLAQIALVGPTRTTVLLTGETGTGKERLAEALHEASPRQSGPFVAVNCAALTETILESELFGHEKGAFSGAHARREGRFKMADGGTIFLDEIGEISPAIQVKLLRVLQQRQFQRVGGNETISVDVRIIAATNRDLADMVASKTFRADLYYRLNVMALEVPPLRARRDDLPLLVEHILPRLALELGRPEPEVTPEAMRLLAAHHWPGNVRELENVLERALVLAQGKDIGEQVLSPQLTPREPLPLPPPSAASPIKDVPQVPGASFAEIERHAIIATYEACGRSPRRTAEILGLSPRTVHYRLREYRGETGRRLRRVTSTSTSTSTSPSSDAA